MTPASPLVRIHLPSGETPTPWISSRGASLRRSGSAERPDSSSQIRIAFSPPEATNRPSAENAGGVADHPSTAWITLPVFGSHHWRPVRPPNRIDEPSGANRTHSKSATGGVVQPSGGWPVEI